MFKDLQMRADGMDKRFDGMHKRFDKVDRRLDTLEVGQAHLKDQLNGSKADLTDTLTRRQFEKLKVRVDRYHPLT